MTHYLIYKITNLINGKFYVGKHMTDDLDDGYMGSGRLLIRAVKKYGIGNFRKDILEVYETEHEMNLAERILVVLDKEVSYNMCPGGQGGWGYINSVGRNRNYTFTNEERKRGGKNGYAIAAKKYGGKLPSTPPPLFTGKKHTNETKAKIGRKLSERQSGESNNQYGTFWITNGVESRKCRNEAEMPNGWYRGRRIKGSS